MRTQRQAGQRQLLTHGPTTVPAVEDHPFNAYLAAQPEPQRSTLQATATSLRKILPGATEAVSYGMPAFIVDGTAIAGLAGFKHHCSYFPHSGAALERIESDLAGYDYDKGTLRFAVDKPLPVVLLRKLVAVRLQMESERPVTNGEARAFYSNGFVQSKGGIRKGELHGAWSWFRKDGTVMRTGQFTFGKQAGPWRTFDRAGRLVKETAL